MEPIIASGLADATASDFAGAVYNIFFAGLVFGAGWLIVQYQRLTHYVRDVEDSVARLEVGLANIQERRAEYENLTAHPEGPDDPV